MSKLSKGEKEFVSDFGELSSAARVDLPSKAGSAARSPAPPKVQELDVRGVSGPLPLLRAHRALRALKPGQELRVITTYAQSVDEFQALAKHVTGYELIAQEALGDEFVHLLRRRR